MRLSRGLTETGSSKERDSSSVGLMGGAAPPGRRDRGLMLRFT